MERGYMDRLDADRLLYNFRENAGFDTKGAKPLAEMNAPRVRAGSIPTTANAPPNSAATSPATSSPRSRSCAATGDDDAKAKGDEMVAELAKVQEKLGGGYLSAFPMELFDRLDALSGKPRDPNAARDTSGKACPGRRSTPSTRSWPACSINISSPATSRR